MFFFFFKYIYVCNEVGFVMDSNLCLTHDRFCVIEGKVLAFLYPKFPRIQMLLTLSKNLLRLGLIHKSSHDLSNYLDDIFFS